MPADAVTLGVDYGLLSNPSESFGIGGSAGLRPPGAGRVFFDEPIRGNLDTGRARPRAGATAVALIFGRRITRRTPTRSRLRVVTNGVVPSLLVDYKHFHVGSRRAASGAYLKRERLCKFVCWSTAEPSPVGVEPVHAHGVL